MRTCYIYALNCAFYRRKRRRVIKQKRSIIFDDEMDAPTYKPNTPVKMHELATSLQRLGSRSLILRKVYYQRFVLFRIFKQEAKVARVFVFSLFTEIRLLFGSLSIFTFVFLVELKLRCRTHDPDTHVYQPRKMAMSTDPRFLQLPRSVRKTLFIVASTSLSSRHCGQNRIRSLGEP